MLTMPFNPKEANKLFKDLLKEKPFNKITVNDIANKCDINRQTFYYHFKDIYDLLEWIFANEVVEKIEKETI